MAPRSKTIMDIESERRMRESDPISHAIKEHERKHHGIFGFFGVEPSKTIPPQKPKSLPPQIISEGAGEINFGNKPKSKLKRILDIIFE